VQTENIGLLIRICAERDEYLISFRKVKPPFANLDPHKHPVLSSQGERQISLGPIGPTSASEDVLARDLGKRAVGGFQHSVSFTNRALASNMRAA
jgi:hypothetical protein